MTDKGVTLCGPARRGRRGGALVLENAALRLEFASHTGQLIVLGNRLTGEQFTVGGDAVMVVAEDFRVRQADLRTVSCRCQGQELQVRYASDLLIIDVRYTLGPDHHFAEKHVALTCNQDCALQEVILSRPKFTGKNLSVVCYPHPSYERLAATHQAWKVAREAGTEPVKTFFGRTPAGGLFTGVEMPFDKSSNQGAQVTLGSAPSLRLRAGETLACEPVYFGVYRRQPADERAAEWRPADQLPGPPLLPLPSESAAMVAMATAVLGPPRHGVVAMACGWHCQMEQHTYTEDSVAGDLRSLDFLKQCGVDWVSDSHPWGGETEKMNALTGDAAYELGPLVRRFLDHAREIGVKVVQWPTMNNTHPWSGLGKPFRADQPGWLRVPKDLSEPVAFFRKQPANCLANRPFYDWLVGINLSALATGYYAAWCMDGDFWGTGAYFNTTLPVECASAEHDHLPGDANFACQRALDRWIATVRERYPQQLIVMCRPPMDLGVWSQRNVDACFTLIETGTGESNIAGGDEVRVASRLRVHHHFFPHYLDWPLLFPSYADRNRVPPWPSTHLDYILLSGLSCSPYLLLYLPTKTGIPEADQAEIRKWLDWGRQNVEFLKVRKDLFDWPAPGRVDGSAHFLGRRGLIFLFNPGPRLQSVSFTLSAEDLGLQGSGAVWLTQEHPASAVRVRFPCGAAVHWEVPAAAVVVLRVEPAD